MADQSDVEAALVALIGGVLYPQGTDAPSVVGRLCRVYRGWPHSAALDDDLAAGTVTVTVFTDPRDQQITTRYPAEFQIVTQAAPAYAVATTATTATISGTPAAGQLVGLLVDEVAVVHRTAATDLPELVAAILAAELSTVRMALVSGATITLPGAARIIGRAVCDQTARSETRRQRQGFRVSLWCPGADIRDQAGAAIDAALSAVTFIALPDGTAGRLTARGTAVLDHAETAALFRRDLLVSVEYATTIAATLPAMIFGDATLAANGGPTIRACLG